MRFRPFDRHTEQKYTKQQQIELVSRDTKIERSSSLLYSKNIRQSRQERNKKKCECQERKIRKKKKEHVNEDLGVNLWIWLN